METYIYYINYNNLTKKNKSILIKYLKLNNIKIKNFKNPIKTNEFLISRSLKLLAIKTFNNFHNNIDIEKYYSLAHTDNAIIFSISNLKHGIDIESITRTVYNLDKISNKYFGDCEIDYILKNNYNKNLRFLKLWTMKESYIKANDTTFINGMKYNVILNLQKYKFISLKVDNYIFTLCYQKINTYQKLFIIKLNIKQLIDLINDKSMSNINNSYFIY